MAEVLEFNEMMFTNFEPKMKNRYIMEIDGIQSYLIKAAARPSINFETVKLDHINTYRKLQGKGEGQDISITLYDPIVPSGAQSVIEWVSDKREGHLSRDGGRLSCEDEQQPDLEHDAVRLIEGRWTE